MTQDTSNTRARLERQISFIIEIDKLKQVFRQTYLTDLSRKENDAEHSWHLALLAILLAEYCPEELNIAQVMKMVLIHDIVEIDAGDTFCYDEEARKSQEERERKAADRIFNLLPEDQAADLLQLWEEFEAGQTPESRFARAIDRFQPLLHNLTTAGRGWQDHGVSLEQVMERNHTIANEAPLLWEYVQERLDDVVREGILPDK